MPVSALYSAATLASSATSRQRSRSGGATSRVSQSTSTVPDAVVTVFARCGSPCVSTHRSCADRWAAARVVWRATRSSTSPRRAPSSSRRCSLNGPPVHGPPSSPATSSSLMSSSRRGMVRSSTRQRLRHPGGAWCSRARRATTAERSAGLSYGPHEWMRPSTCGWRAMAYRTVSLCTTSPPVVGTGATTNSMPASRSVRAVVREAASRPSGPSSGSSTPCRLAVRSSTVTNQRAPSATTRQWWLPKPTAAYSRDETRRPQAEARASRTSSSVRSAGRENTRRTYPERRRARGCAWPLWAARPCAPSFPEGSGSALAGEERAHRHARSGVERHLLAHVHPRPGRPELAHEVDDAVQLVGLEREDPLVVAQGERRDRVGADVREVARHPPVLDEHVTALLVVDQVPVVGPDERVDADVAPRLLVGHEGGDVALVELSRTVQRRDRPHRVQVLPVCRAQERVVCLLERLDGLGVPPDHDVRVGPQTGDVVRAADDDVAGREVGEQLLDLGRERAAVLVAERFGDGEHRPHGVADGVVDLADPGGTGLGRGGAAGVGHGGRAPRWGGVVLRWWTVAAAARVAEAMTAGTPTPS